MKTVRRMLIDFAVSGVTVILAAWIVAGLTLGEAWVISVRDAAFALFK